VAWLVAATAPFVPGELGVRAAFLLCGGLTVVFAALLARELSDDARVPVRAALLAATAPLLHVVGAMALPDAPVAAGYTATLWLLARARGGRWLGAGLALGAALMAKYTAGLLAPALLLLVVWDGELRRELRTPWPWAGALVALAVFAPCLAWNAAHDWVSIRFQLEHGFGQNATVRSFLEYLAGQVAGAGPVVLLVGVAALARGRTAAEKRVAAALLVPLAVTTWSALRGRVEANWTALVFPGLAAAAAVGLARVRAGVARGLVGATVALSLVLLGLFATELRQPRLLAGTLAVERFHGWRDLAGKARALTAEACREIGCDAAQPFVFSANYQYAAALAYYGGFRRLGPTLERTSQLDVWGERPHPGEPFLVVGFDGVSDDFRRAVGGGAEGPTVRAPILQDGEHLRDLTVTPFRRYAGVADRR
jgi:4-amino-4-deoxy-L-arabinose transferase-like glycosyltransferase